jgi:hypothetical protein
LRDLEVVHGVVPMVGPTPVGRHALLVCSWVYRASQMRQVGHILLNILVLADDPVEH